MPEIKISPDLTLKGKPRKRQPTITVFIGFETFVLKRNKWIQVPWRVQRVLDMSKACEFKTRLRKGKP